MRMSREEGNKIVPKLRFTEFANSEGWVIKEVGIIFEVTRGYVLSMSLVSENYSEANPYPVYSSQTKNNGLAGYYKDFLFENAITWTTDGANAGDVNFRAGKFYCTNVCGVLINREGYANACISELLNSVSKKYVSYVGNPKLMNGVMSKIEIPIPSIKEQQKIADCLSSLDELITAENQKLETLKAHKKGLMQQLFPAEGEKVPKLRFKEFKNSGEWDIKPLGEVAENLDSRRVPITENERESGNVPYYGASGIIDYVKDFIFNEELLCISEDGANLVARNYPIAFSISGKTWINNHAHVLRFEKEFTQIIVENYLNEVNLEDYLTGMAQPKLNRSKMDIIPIPVPNPAEQQKIAACLSSINDLLTEQSQKVESLKAHKKGLMQQLFPSIN
jgi:type I restriction enzyme, S subunit